MKHLRSPFLIGYLAMALGLSPAAANPLGGQVAGGNANIQGQGTPTVTITQSTDKAIINWNTFNIGTGERTQFNQPGVSSITLNRVTGGLGPSQIYGTLTANGRIFLVNPNGVLFGAGAVIDTAGFLATTSDIKNDDFMAGRNNFTIPGNPSASIVNLGTITATNGGIAALVAPGVRNSGTITADLGKVALASGNGFTLDFYGDKLITLQVGDQVASQVIDVATQQPLNALVKNEGTLRANGGRVELTAAAARQVVDAVINNTGVIEANTVGTKNGMIVLGAATAADKPADNSFAQNVKIAGTLSAAGKNAGETGGKIQITGEKIALSGAKIDASGKAGGGKVLIGGDVGGGKGNAAVASIPQAALETTSVPTASTVTVDAATLIDVSAKDVGNGGKLVVWSDHLTSFSGSFQARGGDNGGDGGFAEISSKGQLSYNGFGDLRAPAGKFGTLLFDPYNIDIVSATTSTTSTSSSNGTTTFSGAGTSSSSQLSVDSLINALGLGNVIVTTGGTGSPGTGAGDINVMANVNWGTAANPSASSLTLSAYGNINIYEGVRISNIGSGNLTLRADNSGGGWSKVVNYGGTVDWRGSSGKISVFYNPGDGESTKYQHPDFSTAGFLTNPAVTNQLTAYMLVNSVSDLRNINYNLGGTYALGRNINGDGVSFDPIGGPGSPFTGVFDGQYATISNLTIAPTASGLNSIGLFAVNAGTIQNLNLTNVNVSANPNAGTGWWQTIGTLAGQNYGTISGVSVTGGQVNGGSIANVSLGGLVGYNAPGARVASSFSDVPVTSTATANQNANCSQTNPCQQVYAGGLVGQNQGTLSDVYAGLDATVSVGANAVAGSLVGWNDGIINFAWAFGDVTTTVAGSNGINGHGGTTTLGGLVGQNQGVIADSWATGNVGGPYDNLRVGGLVGENSGAILNSYYLNIALGVQAGNNSSAGGLVAENGNDCGGCNTGTPGDGHNNSALVFGSLAFTNVTVGSESLAGGLAASGSGTFASSWAGGTVTGGANSVLGGLVGAVSASTNGTPPSTSPGTDPSSWNALASSTIDGLSSTNAGWKSSLGSLVTAIGITNGVAYSEAFVNVTGTGPNSALGGLVGANGGTIFRSQSYGSVAGANDSFIGGLVGVNLGLIEQSQTLTYTTDSRTLSANFDTTSPLSFNWSASVTGGANDVIGGLVGLNLGTVDASTAAGAVTSGPNSMAGSLIGANAMFINFAPNQVQGSDFPVGTYSTDSVGTGTVNTAPATASNQIGASDPTTLPASYPTIVQGCNDPICTALNTGILGPVGQNSIDQPPPLQVVFNPDTTGIGSSSSQTPINLTQNNPPSGGNPPGGNSGNPPPRTGPPPGPGIGRTLSEQQYSGVPPLGETRFLPGEVVVQISDTVSSDRIQQLARQFGFTVIASESMDAAGRTIYRFKAGDGKNIRDIIRALERNQIVASAQPNYVFNLQQDVAPLPAGAPDATGSLPPPADPGQSDLQSSDMAARTTLPAGDSAQYIIDKLHLGAVHARALGRNVTVAVIDSEIDVTHPDLAGVVTEQFDATGTASSPHAHGTGMAGAIASKRRLLGIAPGVRILAVKAFDETSTSAEATSYQILKGLEWAIDKHVRIINMSFAGPRDLMMERLLQKAYDQGTVLVAAAGNAGPKSPPLYPAADVNVIAVSATDYADKPFKMANRGKYIAVAAPGVDVLVPAPKGSYQLTTGTSVAAAHVSGVAALLLESRPTLRPKDVRAILMNTAHLINPKGRDDITGAGLVDPYQALVTLTARSADTAPATRTVH